MSHEDIERLIEASELNGNRPAFNNTLGNLPPPGYARVIIHKSSDPSAHNSGVTLGVNGLMCLVAQGIEVDIPIKILRGSLMTAVSEIARYNENGKTQEEKFFTETSYSYPFTVLHITEGEDPRHYQHENSQKKKRKNQKLFWKENGFYPTPQQLREWISAGGLKALTKE
jgi:hypothetical protein